jgi:hypothetical protein
MRWLLGVIAVWLVVRMVFRPFGVERVEINGMDCTVNTRVMGAEPCCQSNGGWHRLDSFSDGTSPFVGASQGTCDPSNP